MSNTYIKRIGKKDINTGKGRNLHEKPIFDVNSHWIFHRKQLKIVYEAVCISLLYRYFMKFYICVNTEQVFSVHKTHKKCSFKQQNKAIRYEFFEHFQVVLIFEIPTLMQRHTLKHRRKKIALIRGAQCVFKWPDRARVWFS